MAQIAVHAGMNRVGAAHALFSVPRTMLLTTFLLGVLARLAYLGAASVLGITGDFFAEDSVRYDAYARSLLAGQGYSRGGLPSAFDDPGFPVLLAAIYAIAGTTIAAVGVVHTLIGAATAALIGFVAYRLAGVRAAWIAGLFAAVYPHLLFWTGYVLSETLFVAVLVLALWALVEAQLRQSRRWFLAAGIALALASLTRSVALPFVVVAAACAWWLARGRDRWVRAGLLVVGAMLLLVPWTIRNYVKVGVATPAATKSMIVLYQGNSPGATGGSRGYVDSMDYDSLPRGTLVIGEQGWEAGVYSRYRQGVAAYLADDPLAVVRVMPAKLWNMWRPVYDGSSLRNWIITGTTYGLLLVLAAVGFIASLRQAGPHGATRYVQLLVLMMIGFHAVVTGMIRFRLPVEGALLILAGIGGAWLWARLDPWRSTQKGLRA